MNKRTEFAIMSILILISCLATPAYSEVFVHDTIGVTGDELIIKAETRGRFFVKGGELVDFFVDGKSLGKVLSGGDGYAYKAFIPLRHGQYTITSEYKGENARGIILSLEKESSIVCIDVEGSLLPSLFIKKPLENSREAIQNIVKKYPVVYLQTGLVNEKILKEWLEQNEFPESVVVPWQMGTFFDDIYEKGIKIKAVIGSRAVIESAEEFKPMAFSFEESDDSGHITDWSEIDDKLK